MADKQKNCDACEAEVELLRSKLEESIQLNLDLEGALRVFIMIAENPEEYKWLKKLLRD